MSLINNLIPRQRFEIISEQIGAIIAEELHNQLTLHGDEIFAAKVWLERFIAFDKTELPALNVYYVSSIGEENTPATSKMVHRYQINAMTRAPFSSANRGDEKAIRDLKRLMGAVRYILMNPNYLYLGFSEKFIFTRRITDITVQQPTEKDGTMAVPGQLVFEVTTEELNGVVETTSLQILTTTMKLNETDKGYYFEHIKT